MYFTSCYFLFSTLFVEHVCTDVLWTESICVHMCTITFVCFVVIQRIPLLTPWQDPALLREIWTVTSEEGGGSQAVLSHLEESEITSLQQTSCIKEKLYQQKGAIMVKASGQPGHSQDSWCLDITEYLLVLCRDKWHCLRAETDEIVNYKTGVFTTTWYSRWFYSPLVP